MQHAPHKHHDLDDPEGREWLEEGMEELLNPPEDLEDEWHEADEGDMPAECCEEAAGSQQAQAADVVLPPPASPAQQKMQAILARVRAKAMADTAG